MKRALLIFLVVFFLFGAILAIAWFVPMPLDPFHDFQVLYRANQGILRGIPLYDRAAQEQMVAADLGVPVDRVFVLPFPYPPWFALTTLPLALLPAEVAVRVWFLLNATMLLASVWLVTDGWHPRLRLISFVVAPLFFPILGALIVGQYVFPTILGMAMLAYALRHKTLWMIALGMALVTFKPHVGMLAALAVTVRLLLRRDEFGRRAFFYTAITGAILFALGFLADNNWVVNYPKSLFAFKGVSECNLCVSLPLTISNLAGFGFDQAFVISLALLIGFTFVWIKNFFRMDGGLLVALCTCMALLVNPYLQNYDFAFAIIPLFVLAEIAHIRTDWIVIAFVFLLPWFGLLLFDRGGNITLLISTILMTVLLLTNIHNEHTIVS
ncbi:MAG: glycosyltransferase family 87 protein [Chloroflexota bacterium]